MFKPVSAFSGFSVSDLTAAKDFYNQKLGLEVIDGDMGLQLKIPNSDNVIFVYQKDNHEPASFTILNFPVSDIDAAVAELKAAGITFENYPDLTDENNIARGLSVNRGPDIAWFTDPAGNILSVLQDS